MIDKHHEEAKKSGTRIVPCCGYDCIPFDIGAFATAEYLRHSAAGGGECGEMECLLGKSSGTASGGTIATAMRMMDVQRPGMNDPFFLSPELEQSVGSSAGKAPQMSVAKSSTGDSWTTPSIMAVINSKIVYRSAGLLPSTFNPALLYKESMLAPGLLTGSLVTAGMGLAVGALYFRLSRWLLASTVLPKPGQGPSEQARENGYFNVHFIGTAKRKDAPSKAEGLFSYSHGDPGYAATSLMVLEAALSLLQTQSEVEPGQGGVLTPASALGWTLVERLRQKDFVINVKTAPSHGKALTKYFPPNTPPWTPPNVRKLKSGAGLYPFSAIM
mmetsp:Transcript_33841/g.46850  ORF Transcript_33841/g.46850 Transcript_33841/m.46850 type:complete len:329 (-) Transcript_33841:116-1102(-)